MSDLEVRACTPVPLNLKGFNKKAELPFGLKIEHMKAAMEEFIDFIGFINTTLNAKGFPRFESFLMPANFSSIVCEFMSAGIPKHCKTVVKNAYHNGHPDLLPAGKFKDDKCQHGKDGIEIKASRYQKAWQGHNAEDCWLMVFVFSSNGPRDLAEGFEPKPFKFEKVVGAPLEVSDWKFSGRSETSRRTITASVTNSGCEKMMKNWIYRANR